MVEPIAIATCGTTLMLNSDDLRRDRRPFSERKAALARLRSCDGIQYVEHAEGHCNKSLPPSATLALRASFQKTERPPYGLSKRWIKVKESEGIGGDACSGRDILMQQQSERAANLHALATRLEFTIKQTGDRFTLRRTADVARPVREEGPYFR